MPKPVILITLLLTLSASVRSQNAVIDSLHNILACNSRDTIAVNIYNELASNSYLSNPSDAIMYGYLANELADSLNYIKGRAQALKNIGLGYYFEQKYYEVLDWWEKSLQVYQEMNDLNGASNLTNNLGAVYFNSGDDYVALEYWLRSLQLAEEIEDNYRIASACDNVSSVYRNLKKYDISLAYSLRALKLSEEIQDRESIGYAAVNRGDTYFKMGMLDSALFYFNISVINSAGTYDESYSLNNIGKVYSRKGEYTQAIDYHERAYQIGKSLDENLLVAHALISLGEAYNGTGDFKKAQESYLAAEAIADEIGLNYELQDVYNGLSSTYSNIGDFKRAFDYETASAQVKDTIYGLEIRDNSAARKAAFDMYKYKSEKISIQGLLDVEKERQNLALANDITKTFVLSSIVLTGLLFAVFYQKRTANNERNRAKSLLLNILPSETALELELQGSVQAKNFEHTTVLFTDFESFTKHVKDLEPGKIVDSLNYYFTAFDNIIEKFGLEKIKTIGDSYMCASGVPSGKNQPLNVVKASLEMIRFINESRNELVNKGLPTFNLRIGIHCGPVVAGIVGIKKFQYDIWGDTVNIASRMESYSETNRINISENVYDLVKDSVDCSVRGEIEIDNYGALKMYFVDSLKE